MARRGGARPLSVDFGIWALLGRSAAFRDRHLLVIPAPWVGDGSFLSLVRPACSVPGGRISASPAADATSGIFVLVLFDRYAGLSGQDLNNLMSFRAGIVVLDDGQMVRRQHQRRTGSRSGSASPAVWAYLGWYLLCFSIITIIGWAWVTSAWMRWICRNIQPARGARSCSTAAAGGVVAHDRGALASASSSRFHGCMAGMCALVRVAIRAWPNERHTNGQRERVFENAYHRAGAASLPAPPRPPACRRA
jgi:hypothetical protein